MKRYISYLPLAILVLVFLCFTVILINQSLNANDGRWIYALDDPYIHMSIAKSLILSGVWGISQGSFANASSSILWPLLIAMVFVVTGFEEKVPLFLNIIFAIISILLLFRLTKQIQIPSWLGGLLILPVIFLAPMPAIVMTGMEHIAHFTVSLVVISLVVELLSAQNISIKHQVLLLISTFLLSAVRYEGFFLGLVAACCVVFKGKYKLAVAILGSILLPIILFGMVSVRNGWSFIPNPILLKTDFPMDGISMDFITRSFEHGLWRSDQNPEIQWLIGFSFVSIVIHLISKESLARKVAWLNILFLGMLVPHILWAGFGWFFRYEMYLMGTGIFINLLTLAYFLVGSETRTLGGYAWRSAVVLVLLFWGTPYFSDRGKANRQVVSATTNIYQQQYQMARFITVYFANEPVAINDIGAISYYTNAEVVDLWGLANREVSEEMIQRTYNTESIIRITRNAKARLALIYDSWFQGEKEIPADWIRVGQWTIQNNVVCGDETVSIYALDPEEATELVDHLIDFSSKLPSNVIQRGLYASHLP
jgi:hypothetical protein